MTLIIVGFFLCLGLELAIVAAINYRLSNIMKQKREES